jgi:2-hydroxycyclohexanecarboxyl-CoA dehydrogenase
VGDILTLGGKVALVTGAGRNVGRQIALHFAAHGAGGVVVNDFFGERAEGVAREINDAGGRAIGVAADITKLDGVKAMVARAAVEFGRGIDILVNNAGNAGAEPTANARKPFWETETADWNSFLGVNLYGVINCCAAVIPGMIEQRAGQIVTIISDAGRMGEARLEIYSAAKAGAAGLTRALARGLARYNIRANNVAIAAMNTPAIRARHHADPERAKKSLERYIIRRLGEPSDVANMVLFLASGASDWVTGQTYPVNGGFSFAL